MTATEMIVVIPVATASVGSMLTGLILVWKKQAVTEKKVDTVVHAVNSTLGAALQMNRASSATILMYAWDKFQQSGLEEDRLKVDRARQAMELAEGKVQEHEASQIDAKRLDAGLATAAMQAAADKIAVAQTERVVELAKKNLDNKPPYVPAPPPAPVPTQPTQP